LNEILSRLSFEGKCQYLTKDKVQKLYKIYRFRLLTEILSRLSFEGECHYLTKEKVWIHFYKQSEETLLNIKI
jgi:hypothetical protein